MQKDFNFLISILDDFFAEDYIQKRLSLIESKEITGWEIWLQVELGIFLDNREEIMDLTRELKYSIDKRKAHNREHIAIDFVFRKKHSNTNKRIALEIKQNRRFSSCLRGMMVDAWKMNLLKSSNDNLRSLWLLGVYSKPEDQNINEMIMYYADTYDVELVKNCIATKSISGTNFMYTLF